MPSRFVCLAGMEWPAAVAALCLMTAGTTPVRVGGITLHWTQGSTGGARRLGR